MQGLGLAFMVVTASALAQAAVAQEGFEYGTPDDLKGVSTVYVYTGTDMDLRDNIQKVIKKELPNLTLASRREQAEVHLIFTADVSTYVSGVDASTYGNNSNATVQYGRVIDGRGLVLRIENGKQPLLIFDFKDSRGTIFERRPSTNFARAFVKAYKKANEME